jgi:hypothetical protein
MTKQLACPAPPARLVEAVKPPVFAPDMGWVDWSDALLVWGADEAERGRALAAWIHTQCGGH